MILLCKAFWDARERSSSLGICKFSCCRLRWWRWGYLRTRKIIVGRGFLTPYFAYPATPTLFFFQILSNPFPTPTCAALFIALAEWVTWHIWCIIPIIILINDIMDLYMSRHHSTRNTLLCVLYLKASSFLNYGICSFLLVLWFDIRRTQTKTHYTHRG